MHWNDVLENCSLLSDVWIRQAMPEENRIISPCLGLAAEQAAFGNGPSSMAPVPAQTRVSFFGIPQTDTCLLNARAGSGHEIPSPHQDVEMIADAVESIVADHRGDRR